LASYITGPTAAIASGARQVAYTAERAVQKSGFLQRFWPLLALLALLLIGLMIWGGRSSTRSVAFNADEQVRMAGQKAAAALAALKPGFSANDLVGALNLEVINFSTGSAQIPADNYDFLNKTAAAIKMAPSATIIEIGGHTDNTGDSANNLRLSQERADAVRDYLIKQGVDGSAIVAKGYGDKHPVAANDSDEGRFRNRRIEFSVAPK
jgi:outer membrane protein OmpA-like peptidoglycan-associated protein